MAAILKTPWRRGPAPGEGPAFISLTAYTANRRAELPGIYRNGVRLSRSWPQIEGAIGLWLWGEPLGRRAGSVSAWRSEEAMLRFVRWAPHVAIMRRYRGRGSLVASSWEIAELRLPELWREARARIAD